MIDVGGTETLRGLEVIKDIGINLRDCLKEPLEAKEVIGIEPRPGCHTLCQSGARLPIRRYPFKQHF